MALRRTFGLFTGLLMLAACAAPGASPSPTRLASPTAAAAAPTATAQTATTAPTATAAAAVTDAPTAAPTTESSPALTLPPPNPACERDQLVLKNPGRLTLSTDIPAFEPWWGGDASTQYPNEPETGSAWSDGEFSAEPYSMEGFEGATAYAIAQQMGFEPDEVDWIANLNFDQAFAPGEKPFDFHMAQIAITPERAEAIDFSDPYFDSNQSLLAMTPNEITGATTIAELKDFRLGAQRNTTSFALIEDVIAPNVEEMVYPTNTAAREALVNGQIDGLIVDLSTAFYMRDGQIEDFDTPEPEATIVGQFGPPAAPDFVGAVLDLDSPLTECVNHAIATIKANGTHQALLDQWINTGEHIPFIE